MVALLRILLLMSNHTTAIYPWPINPASASQYYSTILLTYFNKHQEDIM